MENLFGIPKCYTLSKFGGLCGIKYDVQLENDSTIGALMTMRPAVSCMFGLLQLPRISLKSIPIAILVLAFDQFGKQRCDSSCEELTKFSYRKHLILFMRSD